MTGVCLRIAAKALQSWKQLICYGETLVFVLKTLQADFRGIWEQVRFCSRRVI